MKLQFKLWALVPLFVGLVGLVGCSSSSPTKEKLEEVKNDEIQLDYEVRDASHTVRPGWVQNAQVWAEESKKDIEKFRFHSYQTGVKVDRETACELARVQAKADLASEISSFINKTMAVATEGQTNINETSPAPAALQEYVENNLAEKVQGFLHGASLEATYWEKRQYLQKKGATKDYTGYTCAVLLKIENKYLKESIDRAVSAIINKASTPELKNNVQDSLKEVSKAYLEQSGQAEATSAEQPKQ